MVQGRSQLHVLAPGPVAAMWALLLDCGVEAEACGQLGLQYVVGLGDGRQQ